MPYDPAILFLNIYPKICIYIDAYIYSLMFIAPLFTIAKHEDKPSAHQIMDGLKKCVYIQGNIFQS